MLGLLSWRGGYVKGRVLLNGQDILRLPEKDLRKLRGSQVALIPQSPLSALNAAISLKSHFKAAWRAHQSSGLQALERRLEELFVQVHLPPGQEFLDRRPSQISVGQAQRVLIALALLHKPRLIIADEPISALDPVTQSQIVLLLHRLSREHSIGLLYISHDLISVIQLCDQVAVLDTGAIAETLKISELDQARHPATLALLEALPIPFHALLHYRDQSEPSSRREFVSPDLLPKNS